MPFGEKVWCKELRTHKVRQEKFDSEWQEGAWMGHSRSSNEHVIATRQGAVRAYAVKRQDAERRWDVQLLQELQGTPQQPNPAKPGLHVPIRVRVDEAIPAAPVPVAVRERQIRRMKLTSRLLER